MEEEEKGFVIKVRRSFDDKGELKEKGAKEEAPGAKKDAPKKEEKVEKETPETERLPLPEVNFNSLIFTLSSSALLHLGEIADPQTGKNMKDLPLAKHSIDIIAMLKDKTKGNLSGEEQKFLESILTDLRWRYVRAIG